VCVYMCQLLKLFKRFGVLVKSNEVKYLKLRHHRCVCNNEVKDNVGQNTTTLLVGC